MIKRRINGNKQQARRKEPEIPENATSDYMPRDSKEVMSAQPVRSMFANSYLRYDYTYYDDYIKWLLEDSTTVVEPVIAVESCMPPVTVSIRSVDELMKDVIMPTDYIGDMSADSNAGDEGVIEVL